MKLFEIKTWFDGKVLFSLETESIKLTLEAAVKTGADLTGAHLRGAYLRGAYLTGAHLTGAHLRGAYLRGAYLTGAKSYADNHDFFGELIRRRPIETFMDTEWAMIGQLTVHRYCWGEIQERHGQSFLRVLEVLEADGFGEYAAKCREVLTETEGGSCDQAQGAQG